VAARQLVTIPYAPRRAFLPYHTRSQRWAVLVAHRRAGKTVACINDLIRSAALESKQDGRYAYIAPFLKQAKDVAWVYLKRFAQPLIAKVNESELWVELINGARLRIYGADNADALRGGYLDGVVIDEYADMYPSVWGEIIRPMLADRQGWATFIGTPKGRNAFHERLMRAQAESWFWELLPASKTGILPQTELDDARADMTPEQYDQEFEVSFDAAIVGAYYGREIAEAERSQRVTAVPVDPMLPVHRAWDIGVGDATAIWFFQVAGSQIHVVDFYEASGKGAQHFVQEVKARETAGIYIGGLDFVPHDARVREFTSGAVPRQRLEVLQGLGLNLRVVPSHKVADGINAMRVTMARCWFDFDKTRDGLEALRQYRSEWDEKARVFRDRPRHDWTSHAADAARYMAMAWRELSPADRPVTMKEKLAELVRQPTLDEMLADADAEEW
jgi:hypothetical protein